MSSTEYIRVNNIASKVIGINFFAIFWHTVTIIVGSLGFIVLYGEKWLPKKLVKIYKFGKLNLNKGGEESRPGSDVVGNRSLFTAGVQFIADLMSLQVPKR